MNRPILNYHTLAQTSSPSFAPWTVTPANFAAQLDLLESLGLQGVSLAESLDDPGPENVALTFDDGYEDFVTVAVPELTKRGFGATVFIATAHVGDSAHWLDDDVSSAGDLASWDQLRSLAGSRFEVGSHSHSHPHLDLATVAETDHELKTSRDLIQTELNQSVTGFCYPHGFHSRKVRQAVIDAGYSYACAVKHKMSFDGDDRFALARIVVTRDVTVEQLAAFLGGKGLRKSPRSAEHAMARGFREYRRLRRKFV